MRGTEQQQSVRSGEDHLTTVGVRAPGALLLFVGRASTLATPRSSATIGTRRTFFVISLSYPQRTVFDRRTIVRSVGSAGVSLPRYRRLATEERLPLNIIYAIFEKSNSSQRTVRKGESAPPAHRAAPSKGARDTRGGARKGSERYYYLVISPRSSSPFSRTGFITTAAKTTAQHAKRRRGARGRWSTFALGRGRVVFRSTRSLRRRRTIGYHRRCVFPSLS